MDVPNDKENDGTPFNENDVRSIVRKATKGRRHIIAARMTRILGRNVSPPMFAEFCRKAPGRRHTRFPATWVKAFCEAVGDDEMALGLLPESARHALSASTGIVESRKAVARAQEALSRVQAELAKLAEGKRRKKPQGWPKS
jgi:hypothetical protein